MQASQVCSRRAFLQDAALGFGTLALAHLLQTDRLLGTAWASPGGYDLAPRIGHLRGRAKSIILLMQSGGPSQVDLFDPKPELEKRNGQRHPGQVESFQPGSQSNLLMAGGFRFRKHGHSGMEFSELLPHLAGVADDICMVRSMYSDNNNHPQAMRCINTGKIFAGRPTLGAWVSYALGTENQNLPAFIVLRDPDGHTSGGTTLWESGWLPAQFGGTEIQSRGSAVLNLHPHAPLPPAFRKPISMLWSGSMKNAASSSPMSPSWKRAFGITNLPPACNCTPSACSTCHASRLPCAGCTVWTIQPPRTSARAASWPAASWKRASASSR